MLRFHALFILSLSLVTSCSDVKFSQNNKQATAQSAQDTADITCTVAEGPFYGLNPIEISLTADPSVDVNFDQVTKFEGEAQGEPVVWVRQADLDEDGRAVYRINESGESSFTPTQFGSYSLEVYIPSIEKVQVSCDFVVEEQPEEPVFSCDVDPASARSGILPAVNVTATGYSGMITQKVSGPETPETTLKNVEGSWIREDGKPNTLAIYTAGQYTVDISKDTGEQTSCSFEIKEASATCQEGEIPVGSHVAFMIDNSGSNGDTDCSGRENLILPGQEEHDGFHYKCSQANKNNRERAVAEAFDALKTFSDQTTQDKPLAASQIAITKFPLDPERIEDDKAFQRNPREGSGGWFDTDADELNDIVEAMKFTYFPYGNTPYYTALDGAVEVFGSLTTDERKNQIAILVTDAEPTDRNPALVVERAQELKDKGVKIITVFLKNSEDRNKRLADHEATLKNWDELEMEEQDKHYYNSEEYGDFDSYFNDIKTLASDVASSSDPYCEGKECPKLLVEGARVEDLPAVLKGIIQTHAIKCE